jgi:Sulfotransferase family
VIDDLVEGQSFRPLEDRGIPGSASADPVFVLCNGRSGSTLLRFVLDAHPELACPPETNLPGLCAHLTTVWSLIEGAPLSAERNGEPPNIPDAAISGVRKVMDWMISSYLDRRGKTRFCDKNLGTAQVADLLARIYPQAKFVCLYRHPMDLIASGLEANPWGLQGYGFDPYIAATPGNAVLALASYWADGTAAILRAEEKFADRAIRVRYEDLVASPEDVAAQLFSFLGVDLVPGITETCFSGERERFGPADYKIWSTSKITTDSIGRGWSIPAELIPPPLLNQMNELAGKLGYLAVDGAWGTSAPPADLRTSGPAGASDTEEVPSHETASTGSLPPDLEPTADHTAAGGADTAEIKRSQWLGDQLLKGLASADTALREQWGAEAAESFVAVVLMKDSAAPAEYWLADVGAGTVEFASHDAQENSDWDVVGSADVWEQVTAGRLNLSVAVRSCRLRYCFNEDAGALPSVNRMRILGHLLGLAEW